MDRADFADRTPLYVACQTGHTATATLLLGAGAAVNAVENNGRTPLYVAAAKGQAEVAQPGRDGPEHEAQFPQTMCTVFIP